MSVPTWLSLEAAAKRLSVHPATLREWADRGQIRTSRTPGGHRRFSEADVAELGAHAKPDLSLLMHATVGHARIATSGGRLATESWYSRFDEVAKIRQRELGMQLVQMLVSFLGDADRDWSAEIRQLGARYAELARGAGLSLGDAMRAFHLFEGIVRSSMIKIIAAKLGRENVVEGKGLDLDWWRVMRKEGFS